MKTVEAMLFRINPPKGNVVILLHLVPDGLDRGPR